MADDRSFSRAARRLGVAQPTLSRAVRAFEDETGIVVFERTTRWVALTDAGALLVERARDVLESLDGAIQESLAVATGAAARVRLGFVIGAANGLLPQVVRSLRIERQDIDLRLEHLSVDAQVVALSQRRIDIGLLRLPADASTGRLVVTPVLREPLVLAISDAHPLATAGADAVPLAALRKEPFVFWPRAMATSLHDEISLEWQRAAGEPPDIVLTARDTQALLGLVAAGVGATLVTHSTAAALHRTGVTYRPLRDAPTTTVAVAHRPHASPAVEAVIDAVKAAAREVKGHSFTEAEVHR